MPGTVLGISLYTTDQESTELKNNIQGYSVKNRKWGFGPLQGPDLYL